MRGRTSTNAHRVRTYGVGIYIYKTPNDSPQKHSYYPHTHNRGQDQRTPSDHPNLLTVALSNSPTTPPPLSVHFSPTRLSLTRCRSIPLRAQYSSKPRASGFVRPASRCTFGPGFLSRRTEKTRGSYVAAGSRLGGFHGLGEGLPGAAGWEGGDKGSRDWASSSSPSATSRAGVRGVLHPEVAAKTMPPFGRVEVPER